MINTSLSQKKSLETLIQKLEDFKNRLQNCDYTHKKEDFLSIMQKFRKYIAKIDDTELCSNFYHSRYYEEYKTFFRNQNDYYMRALEAMEAVSIIRNSIGKDSLSDSICKEYMKERYLRKSREINSLDFQNAKNMVIVGCGPFPDTMLFINENTDIKNIIGLDNNQEAIYIAGEMIHALGMERIRLEHIDGLEYDYSDADIVYIEGFVPPKTEILRRISKTNEKDDLQILVDSPTHLMFLLYETVTPSVLPARLKITNIISSTSPYCRQEMLKIEKFKI
jgi:hypothetical protein